jgi:hypothetical protein
VIPFANQETDPQGPAAASAFGGPALAEQAELLADHWLDLFNLATLPFY